MLLGATVGCGSLSILGEHPLTVTVVASAMTASAATRANRLQGCECMPAEAALLSMFFLGKIRTAPPASTEGLEQRCGISEATGLRLHQTALCLLIGLLGA